MSLLRDALDGIRNAAIKHGANDEVAAAIAHADVVVRMADTVTVRAAAPFRRLLDEYASAGVWQPDPEDSIDDNLVGTPVWPDSDPIDDGAIVVSGMPTIGELRTLVDAVEGLEEEYVVCRAAGYPDPYRARDREHAHQFAREHRRYPEYPASVWRRLKSDWVEDVSA